MNTYTLRSGNGGIRFIAATIVAVGMGCGPEGEFSSISDRYLAPAQSHVDRGVLDATQERLPVWSSSSKGHRAVVSDDEPSAPHLYSIGALPWVQEARLFDINGAMDSGFAGSVALSGNTALLGTNEGDVRVFIRNGATWTEQGKLVAPDGVLADGFGASVALLGDTALVGAPYRNFDNFGDQGAVYVFVRNVDVWTLQTTLVASDASLGGSTQFGWSISLSGDTALIGANNARGGKDYSQGAAYVFVRQGNTWTEQIKISAVDGEQGDDFGNAVALSGDTAIVGADFDTVSGHEDQGAAYVFVRNGENWTQQAKLVNSSGAVRDYFGTSLALSGDTAIVGGIYEDIGGNEDQGSAHVFVRNGGVWTEQARLVASDAFMRSAFGRTVALEGDTAFVSTQPLDVLADVNREWVYVFERNGDMWTEATKLKVPEGTMYGGFGTALSVSGSSLLVGAGWEKIGENWSQGAAYVFKREEAVGGSGGSGGSAGSGAGGNPEMDNGEGCTCRTSSTTSTPPWALFALVLLAKHRRRSARS